MDISILRTILPGDLALVATQVGVLFALMAVGAVCRRTRLLDDAAVRGIVNVLVLVVTPALIVHCFQRDFDPSKLAALGTAFGIAEGLQQHKVLLNGKEYKIRITDFVFLVELDDLKGRDILTGIAPVKSLIHLEGTD